MMGRLKAAAHWLWQLGDVALPIGRPWFRIWPLSIFRFLVPISWQGWIAIFALASWLTASGIYFVWKGWEPSSFLLYSWFFPTFAISSLIFGSKIDVSYARNDGK
jgi:hypothetical protein